MMSFLTKQGPSHRQDFQVWHLPQSRQELAQKLTAHRPPAFAIKAVDIEDEPAARSFEKLLDFSLDPSVDIVWSMGGVFDKGSAIHRFLFFFKMYQKDRDLLDSLTRNRICLALDRDKTTFPLSDCCPVCRYGGCFIRLQTDSYSCTNCVAFPFSCIVWQ